MKTATIRNFHIPLPEQLYLRLKEAAQRQRRPATQLAKQAVEYWLEEQEKLTLHEEIASYAAEVAGAEEEPMLDWRMREFRLFLRERRSDEAGGGILGGP